MGISGSARSASAGVWRIDRRDRVERDRCRHRASAPEREVARLTVGRSHDVSTVLGIGRQRGSQPRANTSTTIMRAPQSGHGQGSTGRASGVISGSVVGEQAGPYRAVRGLPRCSQRGWRWQRAHSGGSGGSPLNRSRGNW